MSLIWFHTARGIRVSTFVQQFFSSLLFPSTITDATNEKRFPPSFTPNSVEKVRSTENRFLTLCPSRVFQSERCMVYPHQISRTHSLLQIQANDTIQRTHDIKRTNFVILAIVFPCSPAQDWRTKTKLLRIKKYSEEERVQTKGSLFTTKLLPYPV